MSQTHPTPDCADRAFSAFFRAHVPHPWPAAPADTPVSEPARAGRPGTRRSGNRARLTLVASGALLAGAFYVLAGDVPSSGRVQKPGAVGGPDFFGASSAKTPDAFGQTRGGKAKATDDPTAGFRPGPVKLP